MQASVPLSVKVLWAQVWELELEPVWVREWGFSLGPESLALESGLGSSAAPPWKKASIGTQCRKERPGRFADA